MQAAASKSIDMRNIKNSSPFKFGFLTCSLDVTAAAAVGDFPARLTFRPARAFSRIARRSERRARRQEYFSPA